MVTLCGILGHYDCGAEGVDRNMSLMEVEEELLKLHGPKAKVGTWVAHCHCC